MGAGKNKKDKRKEKKIVSFSDGYDMISEHIPHFNFGDLTTARKYIIHRRKELSPEKIHALSEKIWKEVSSSPEFESSKKIACFVGVKGEPDISERIFRETKGKKMVFLPVVEGDEISFFLYTGELRKGSFGIPEPVSSERVEPWEIDLFVVPGVLFDLRGFRAGYGKGFYDKALSLRRKNSYIFALAWSFQVFREIPYEKEHDVFVDKIFTEKFVVLCREKKIVIF